MKQFVAVIAAVVALAGSSIAAAADADRWPPLGVSYQDGRPQTYLAPWPLPYSPPYQKI